MQVDRDASGDNQLPGKHSSDSERNLEFQNDFENPMDLAIAFANLVTVPSDKPWDWVARKGNESIFCVLSKIFPEVVTAVQDTRVATERNRIRTRQIFFCHILAVQPF